MILLTNAVGEGMRGGGGGSRAVLKLIALFYGHYSSIIFSVSFYTCTLCSRIVP